MDQQRNGELLTLEYGGQLQTAHDIALGVKLGFRRPVGLAQWVASVAVGLVAIWIFGISLLMVLAETPSPFPVTEIPRQQPYVDFIGRECRIVADVRAT